MDQIEKDLRWWNEYRFRLMASKRLCDLERALARIERQLVYIERRLMCLECLTFVECLMEDS